MPSPTPNNRTALVTGASGFIGRALIPALEARGWQVRTAARRPLERSDHVLVGDLGPDTDWRAALAGIDAVFHLAARVHQMQEDPATAREQHRRANLQGTLRLARQAEEAGVSRFLYFSSVKALAESAGHPMGEDAPARPLDAYGRSKRAAEEALLAPDGPMAGGMAVTVIRPPLVHGPGAGGNLARLMGWIERGRPLPFDAALNRRSMVSVANLADAAVFLAQSESAAGRIFHVTDGEAATVRDFLRHLAAALNRPARLWPIPPSILRFGGSLLGRGDDMRRFLDTLVLEDQNLRSLGWQAPQDLPTGLKAMADAFRDAQQANRERRG
ncbi:MAG: NAD-dependent epimerase/dehydratase family protein [Rhodospirillales bacterium]